MEMCRGNWDGRSPCSVEAEGDRRTLLRGSPKGQNAPSHSLGSVLATRRGSKKSRGFFGYPLTLHDGVPRIQSGGVLRA